MTAKGTGYARGARILGIGIAATGLVTFAYFAVAANVLDAAAYGRVSLLWSVLFVVMSVIYRPVEQLLSRGIARRRAAGDEGAHPLRVPGLIQAGFAAAFALAMVAARGPIQDDLFDGSAALWWVLLGAGLAYAASYFARGFVAGHGWFGLYGGLVLFEALARVCFPVGVALGIASGQTAVALGIVAAPVASLLVIPWAFARRSRTEVPSEGAPVAAPAAREGLREGAGFAGAVAAIQLAEQTLLNAAVLLVGSSVTAGVVFSALLIVRAPLQLFQAVQTSLLPHLAGLDATAGADEFARAIRTTLLAITGFAGLVALGLLALGPWAMELLFDETYGRWGLALLAVGMGLHLSAGTLNQAALARGRAGAAAAAWALVAIAFVLWMLAGPIDDELVRTQVGYATAAGLLCLSLGALTRRTSG